jgi:hypothetical protein
VNSNTLGMIEVVSKRANSVFYVTHHSIHLGYNFAYC